MTWNEVLFWSEFWYNCKSSRATLVKSEWNWSLTLLMKKFFAFFSAPASYAVLGERQTYRAENALPKTL